MGEVVNDILDGFICQQCGGFIDGESPGYPRTCDYCEADEE